MVDGHGSLYGTFKPAARLPPRSAPHLAFVQAYEQGDLADFIRMVQKSLQEEPEMGVVSATTALHRLARGWSAGNGVGAELASATVDVLVLLSHRLADIFRYANSPSSLSGLGELQPRHVAITAWSFATLQRCPALKLRGEHFTALFRPLAEAAVPRIPDFDGQSLGNLLWGCAVTRQVNRRLFFVASRRTRELLASRELGGQNLSNILWSFSQVRLPNHALFQEVARHPEVFDDDTHKVSSQHITNILWAFSRIHGKLGMFRSFFDAGAEAAIPKLGTFKTQELANLLWTFANQTMYHEDLFAAVAEHAKGRIAEFDNFDLSQLLWSFAKVWWRDANLLGEAAQDMLFGPKNRLKRMCAQDLGCVLWAFAMLQWPDEALFQSLARAVREQFGTLKPLDIGNVAWALAMSNQMDVSTARMIADHALRQPGDSFGHDFGATAEGWVHVLSSLEEPLSGTVVDLEKWEGLKARFNAAIFAPLCEKLQRLRRVTEAEGDTAQRMMDMRQELGLVEAWVGDLQLEHLGPEYSELLASRCGLWSPGEWTTRARNALEAFEKTSSQCTSPERMQDGVQRGKSYRVGLHQSKVLAWLAYDLQLRSPTSNAELSEPGQVVSYGRAERDFCPHWQAAEKLLLPLASTSHSRGGHAERVAMLQVFAHALRCAAGHSGPGAAELTGDVWLFASHWPCISCLAVLCQATALARSVRFHLCWDGFASHSEPHAPPAGGEPWTAAALDHRDRAACGAVYAEAGIQHLLEAREEDRFEEIRCKSGCGLLWIEGDLGSGELARRSFQQLSQIPSLALQISQHS
ncbi:RAP [Symbiodinium necroappetens]|uniref:RAP protein n=1 Tax=Symbiodinium necroappetens TaxID=1628268 RepID=A0A812RPF6_9DINO|nr:RAP [Symbiodinium necroappetens]